MAKKPLGELDITGGIDVSGLKRESTQKASPGPAEGLTEALKATSRQFVTTRHVEQPRPLVKDAFAMPAEDYALIAQSQERAGLLRRPNTAKVTILRAALHALASLDDETFLGHLDALPELKKGRRT